MRYLDGHFSYLKRLEITKKKNVIFYAFTSHCVQSCTTFGTTVGLNDLINSDNCVGSRLRNVEYFVFYNFQLLLPRYAMLARSSES